MSSKRKKKIKFVLEFAGYSYEIIKDAEGKKHIRPTQNISKAVPILVPNSPKRCPYSPQHQDDGCLENITGEALFIPNYNVSSLDWRWDVNYLDIATCVMTDKDFIIAKESEPKPAEIPGRCIWCKSDYVEKISNTEGIADPFFLPSNLQKYRVISCDCRLGFSVPNNDKAPMSGILIEGMTIEEINIFRFKEPWKCKHCRRIFGYEIDFEDGKEALECLIIAIRQRQVQEFIARMKILQEALMRTRKDGRSGCPYCLSEIIPKKTKCNFWFDFDEGSDFRDVTIVLYRYKCWKCKKFFFAILDYIIFDIYYKRQELKKRFRI